MPPLASLALHPPNPPPITSAGLADAPHTLAYCPVSPPSGCVCWLCLPFPLLPRVLPAARACCHAASCPQDEHGLCVQWQAEGSRRICMPGSACRHTQRPCTPCWQQACRPLWTARCWCACAGPAPQPSSTFRSLSAWCRQQTLLLCCGQAVRQQGRRELGNLRADVHQLWQQKGAARRLLPLQFLTQGMSGRLTATAHDAVQLPAVCRHISFSAHFLSRNNGGQKLSHRSRNLERRDPPSTGVARPGVKASAALDTLKDPPLQVWLSLAAIQGFASPLRAPNLPGRCHEGQGQARLQLLRCSCRLGLLRWCWRALDCAGC